MLIDASYFTKGFRRIANTTLGVMPNPQAAEVLTFIQGHIDHYEPRFLRDMFGDICGERIARYVHDKDTQADIYDADMERLCDRLREPCADYVYFHIVRDIMSSTTINGQVRYKSADTYVSPIRRQTDAWNDMVDRNRGLAVWLRGCRRLDLSIRDEMLTKVNVLNL